MIVQNFDLNLIPESAPVVVHCDQYDEGEGRLHISLFEGDLAYSPSGTAQIQGTKPDGKGFLYNAALSGNVVTANLEKQMTPVAGRVMCQVVVAETTGRTGSFKFILDVQASALPDDSDMSESDYQAIEELIEDAQEIAQDVAEDKEAAEAAAQASSDSAEDSEAWANGTRNGTAVPSTDPTYQNNSHYWASQAEQYAQGGLKFIGTIYFASLPTSGMRAGDMYNIKDAFTTDSRFEEGAGITYPEGTNIAWTPNGKWDVLAGNIRVLVSITLAQFNALTTDQKNDPTIWWWVPDANNGTMGGSVSNVTAYPELTDLPSVNGHTIIGAMNSSTLEIAGKIMPVGSTVYVDGEGTTATVGQGAEIFNDYRTRGNNNANGNVASGAYSHAEGNSTTASGAYSHAEGYKTNVSADRGHAEGNQTTVTGTNSHAEGISTTASGGHCHAEGDRTTASGHRSHAEGEQTTASGNAAHAEGYVTTASGDNCHAEGQGTKAIGYYSHAEGLYTEASGQSSHAGGANTKATQVAQTAIGKYNSPQANTLFEVGNGSSDSARSNAFEVYQNGDINLMGGIKIGGNPLFYTKVNEIYAGGYSTTLSAYFNIINADFYTTALWDTHFSKYKPLIIIKAAAYEGGSINPNILVRPSGIYEGGDGKIYCRTDLTNLVNSPQSIDHVMIYVIVVQCTTNTATRERIE